MSEQDPVFMASPAATITETKKTEWDSKQNTISDLETIRSGAEKGATAVQPSSLATVATSGSYNDLSNKPTIPSAVTESTVSGWGFTKNTGTYSKPSGGIPKSDLASAVQTSLGKADTALQSYTEQYKGTITGVSANGTSVATSGVANIPAASTSAYGVTKLSSATNSTSTTLAATASAVKAAYDLANGKQDKLVSGTNIKTINGTSLLGSGDITISGGGSSSGGSGAYAEVNHGTSDNTFTLTPNTFHVWDEVTELTLTLGSETSGVANEFLFQFTSGATATTLSLPSDLKWASDSAPTIAENMIYQVSILKGLASVLEFGNTPSKITNTIKQNGTNLVFDYPVASEVTVVFYGRASGTAASSSPTNVTLVYSVGEQSKAIRTLFNFVSVTPSEDDTYIYTF